MVRFAIAADAAVIFFATPKPPDTTNAPVTIEVESTVDVIENDVLAPIVTAVPVALMEIAPLYILKGRAVPVPTVIQLRAAPVGPADKFRYSLFATSDVAREYNLSRDV